MGRVQAAANQIGVDLHHAIDRRFVIGVGRLHDFSQVDVVYRGLAGKVVGLGLLGGESNGGGNFKRVILERALQPVKREFGVGDRDHAAHTGDNVSRTVLDL